ncbi:MAG: hypothetical protein J6A15_08790 [Clostridia bacterium]|nr:hypothetical protein [Clostridia bacterium]
MDMRSLYNANVPQNIGIILNELINKISDLRVLKNYLNLNTLKSSEKRTFSLIFNNIIKDCLNLIDKIDNYITERKDYFVNYVCLYYIDQFNKIIM